MDEMTAFDQQIAREVLREAGPSEPVAAAAIFSSLATATQSPKRRFQTMFSATRFVVVGAIVALFGGFLLMSIQTQRPSDDSNPAALATATASPDASPSATPSMAPTTDPDTVVRSDLLPGVDLVTEEVRPGVFRVLGDGIRDVEAGSGVRGVAVDKDGGVWVLRGDTGDWNVEQLGEPGVSFHRSGKRVSLSDFGGIPLITVGGRSMWLEDGSWVERAWTSECPGFSLPVRDGACWEAGLGRAIRDRLHRLPISDRALHLLVRDGWRLPTSDELGMRRLEDEQKYVAVTPTELGLPDGRIVDYFTVSPDGTGWATVRSVSPGNVYPTALAGLLHYDGETWTFVPAGLTDAPEGGLAWTVDLTFTPDGTVWIAEGSPDGVRIEGWDGTTWSSYRTSDLPESWTSPGTRTIGTHVNADGTIWFLGGTLFFDGDSLHTLDLDLMPGAEGLSIAPDGHIWLATDDDTGGRHLYVITPEAAISAE